MRFVVDSFSGSDDFIVRRLIKLDFQDVQQYVVQHFVSIGLVGPWSEPKRIFDFEIEK